MNSNLDNDLQSYFTDVEQLRQLFREYAAARSLAKRIVIIHGVGGSGKSSLLRMFRIHCKSEKIPVALSSGDDAKSVFDVIKSWMDDLEGDGVKFAALRKTVESYQAIQARVEDQVKKAKITGSRVADIASKAASKTAETAGGALLGAAIGSVIPGVGTVIGGALGGVVSGMSAEVLTDWLRGFLTKPDIDLLLDPSKKLTTDFLADMAKAGEKKRVVLLLDTYEQMTVLEDWVGEVVQRVHPNTLVVIAGRKLPDWNRTWPEWMLSARVEELKPMTEENMRQLIGRYYSTMRGGEPDPTQVETIIRFARGLPMVITSAVQLWVKYGLEDFQSVKAEIVANLVDRLMEGVSDELTPALEAAAVVRWFDQPILRALSGLEDTRAVYNELRKFPFVRARVEGLSLHDSVREIMDENLRVQDVERHSVLHERAAQYFEKRLEKATGSVAERLGLERLYHLIRVDEESGIKLFQQSAEELTQFRLINRLRTLLNDVNTYPLEHENSKLWREYYSARLAHLLSRWSDAEQSYASIGNSEFAEQKLQAYALCDLGELQARMERLSLPGGAEQARHTLRRSLEVVAETDSKLVFALWNLHRIPILIGDEPDAFDFLEQQYQRFSQTDDYYGKLYMLGLLTSMYGLTGDWKKAYDHSNETRRVLKTISKKTSPIVNRHAPWFLIGSGRYTDAEKVLRERIALARSADDSGVAAVSVKDLGFVLGLQEKYDEADLCFTESISEMHELGYFADEGSGVGFRGVILYRKGELTEGEQYLTQSLDIKKSLRDNIGIPEIHNWLGEIYETKAVHSENKGRELSIAESHYLQSREYRLVRRYYFECAAITGLIRVRYMQNAYDDISPLISQAERLGQQYEYNDHLASIRLIQGHLAWKSKNQAGVLSYYQQALIHALRYNRFLLDEILSGRRQGTPLRPIITHCLEYGEEGKKILLALFDWWQTGINDLDTLSPDTISPIPGRIPLLEAEKIARERETGDESPQVKILEQIETGLQAFSNKAQ